MRTKLLIAFLAVTTVVAVAGVGGTYADRAYYAVAAGVLVAAVIGVVTARRMARPVEGLEADLRAQADRNEETLRLGRDIAENMAEGLLVIRSSDGIITYTNRRLDEMFGYAPGELIDKQITLLNASGAKTPEETAAAIAAGLREDGHWRGEVYNRKKDGTPFWNRVSVSTFESSSGPVFVSVHENIHERKKAEEAFRVVLDGTSRATGERYFPLLVQHLATALGVRSAFAAEVINDAGSRLRLLGLYDNGSMVEPYEYDTAGAPCEKVIEDGRAHYAEGVCQAFPDDEELQRWGIESYLAIALRDPAGNPIGHLGIGDDRPMPVPTSFEPILEIFAARAGSELERMRATNALAESEETLRRHRDQLEELVAERTADLEASHEQLRITDRLAAIGTLAAGVGHDMANLLLPLRCRLDALEQEDLSTSARDQLREARRSTDYLQQLTEGLRMLSLDPEEIDASSELTELAGWWDEVGGLIASALPPEARLSVDWAPDLPPVRVSTHRLSQAVLNLVVNAGQALEDDGFVHVRVDAHVSSDKDLVHISVADDGRGMSPEVRRRAFDPFFTTRTRGLRSGLGLSLVRGVAVSAGGSVEIESEPGKGTTVLMTLPTAESASLPVEPRHRGRASVSIRDPRIASLAATLLEASGFDLVEGDPGASDLWITESSLENMGPARRFLDSPGRRLIVVGDSSPEWAELDIGRVPEAGDFETMRAQIRKAAVALVGAA